MNVNASIPRHGAMTLAALLAGMLAAAQADAQSRNDVTIYAPAVPENALVRFVSYADLNLASLEGRARLESRVRGAVRRVCPEGHPGDLTTAGLTGRCQSAAWEGARPQMTAAIANAGRGYAMRGDIAVAARP